MTTIVINENSKKGKIIIDLIREMGVGRIIDNSNKAPNKTTINAVEDAKAGYTTKCTDFDDYLNKVK
jgi:lysophospholipid acyltransferase (LPLAT)-like uncharacterized protein